MEVLDGLTAGDRIITHGNDKVRSGQQVVVQAVDDGTRSLQEMLGSGR